MRDAAVKGAFAAVLVMLLAILLPSSPAHAENAEDLGEQCNTAMSADDWGKASVLCQQAYEALTQEARSTHDVGLRYSSRDLADTDLGAAGYANLHFDPDTGRDQLTRAIADLKDTLADPHCPPSEKDYIAQTALPMLQDWAQYQPDDGE